MEYENVLLGNQTVYMISKRGDNKAKVEESAAELFRYVFSDILQWTPQMVRDYLTNDLIDWLKLRRAYKKLHFPPELDPATDLFYVACILYPDEIHYSKKDITLEVYEKVLNGELVKFPKGFFSEQDGIDNLKICFSYAVGQEYFMLTKEELYERFRNKKGIDEFLSKWLLRNTVYKYFESALDLLHQTLPSEDQSDLFYQHGKFLLNVQETKEVMRKNANKYKRKRAKAEQKRSQFL